MTYLSKQTSPKQTVELTVRREGGKQITLEVQLEHVFIPWAISSKQQRPVTVAVTGLSHTKAEL